MLNQKSDVIGERVKMTPLAIERHLHKGKEVLKTGTIVGGSRDGKRLYVQHDGYLSRQPYATEFWELS